MSPSSDNAAFFLPGLVHQFGNLLLTIQGQALTLDPAGFDRGRSAILAAVQRGADGLQVLRVLLGDALAAPAAADELLRQLAELARVPLRERGLSLAIRGDRRGAAAWQPADRFVASVAEALRRWVLAIPPGSGGAVTLRLDPAADGSCVVALGYEPGPGTLPFPLPVDDVTAALSPLARRGVTALARAHDATLALRFPGGALSAAQEA